MGNGVYPRVSYGLIVSVIVLIGLLVVGGAILLGKSSFAMPVVVIVTATPQATTPLMVHATAIPAPLNTSVLPTIFPVPTSINSLPSSLIWINTI